MPMSKELLLRQSYEMPRKQIPIVKQNLYQLAGGHCQYEGGCEESDINNLTIDHIISKCIARVRGWTRRQVNAISNLQLLCQMHHTEKDSETPKLREIETRERKAFAA
jgi:5-methylcytosine-specific restriction endonuclease McrA